MNTADRAELRIVIGRKGVSWDHHIDPARPQRIETPFRRVVPLGEPPADDRRVAA